LIQISNQQSAISNLTVTMFCDEALEAIEAVATGELTPDGRIADHLATCPDCAAALDSARKLERLLQARAVPQPPANFTSRTLARVRRARWRSEQFLDVGFNAAIVAIVAAIFVGLWMLLNRSGLTAVSGDAMSLFRTGVMTVVRQVTPSLPLYAGAMAVVLTALALWWWAERSDQQV
jgi:anti-sigma factor RsiW